MMSATGDQIQFSPERDCKPLKVIGAASHWSCCQWDLQTWVDKLNGTLFTFRLHPNNPADDSVAWENESAAKYELSLHQFIEWRSGNIPSTSDNPLKNVPQNEFWAYSSYNHLAKIKSPPSELSSCLKWSDLGFGNKLGDASNSTLWIGTKKASTPCHFDTYAYNLVVQIRGKKKWTLFPPQDTPNLYPTRIPYEESSVFSEVNFEGINPVKFPLVSRTTPYIVILEPGDVLYVPSHWWHWVQCVDDDDSTISSTSGRELAQRSKLSHAKSTDFTSTHSTIV
ncbi:HSPB1-associated protein 1-like isoform X2 [Brevipalpus obovatus]|uniref:HSPB1-associated protein 1-like isoform X2 n=1 Tax=Brevipalpus obovatus TaxID=246614 RepID=UPI003D9DF548